MFYNIYLTFNKSRNLINLNKIRSLADVFTKEKRSEVMSSVKSSNTKPEILVRRMLFSKGFRFSIHDTKLPGSPDIKLKKYKTLIFVNGCFWHGHTTCRTYNAPKTNKRFWEEKIIRNKLR